MTEHPVAEKAPAAGIGRVRPSSGQSVRSLLAPDLWPVVTWFALADQGVGAFSQSVKLSLAPVVASCITASTCRDVVLALPRALPLASSEVEAGECRPGTTPSRRAGSLPVLKLGFWRTRCCGKEMT